MNEHMRRFLDDEWDEIDDRDDKKRDEKKSSNNVKQERRQQGKEWGRSIAKFHRQNAKFRPGPGKP